MPVAGAGLDPRTRGSVVHALLERDDTDLAPLAASWGLELTEDQYRRRAAAHRRLRRLTARAAHRARPLRPPRARLRAALGDTLLTGVVDVLAHERGGQLVVDYKTDALDPGSDRRPTSRSITPSSAGSTRWPRCVAALPASRSPTRFSSGRASRSARASRPPTPIAWRRELRALAGGLLAGEYPVAAVPHRGLCLTCPGRRALCSYDEELTLRALGGA